MSYEHRPVVLPLVLGIVSLLAISPVAAQPYDVSRMLTDFERPYIYALDPGSSSTDTAFLLFIRTDTEIVEKAIPIGTNPTDMTISYGEDLLYVTDWLNDQTHVVDLQTQEEIAPLNLGTDVFRINAGRPGRIYTEEEDQWISVRVYDTQTGQQVGRFSAREGDGEVDPTGRYYYHCDNNISNAHVTKWDVTTDSPVSLATSTVHAFGSRNLVLSGDGSRLFWRGYVFDADLNELKFLGQEIYATTVHGDLAISDRLVLDARTGKTVYALPFPTRAMAVSGDQSKLFLFEPATGSIRAIPMDEVAEVPGPDLRPNPDDGATIVLPLDELSWSLSPLAVTYDVYFGTDRTAVAAAGPGSAEHLGEVSVGRIAMPQPLELGQTYYWRVDIVGFTETTTGAVWSFTVAPLVVSPRELVAASAIGVSPPDLELELTADGESVSWSVSEEIPWLELSHGSGVTPDNLIITFDVTALEGGVHEGTLSFESGEHGFEVPVELELFELRLTKMLADFERPYIYALQRSDDPFADAFLLFIHSDTGQLDRAIPIGANPTDMTINYGEDMLYVTNWKHDITRVVDLESQRETAPLFLGDDVFKINAGRPGRIYTEGFDRWINIGIVDTELGEEIVRFSSREGDGEVDPTGRFYYHCDNNISIAKLTKWDVSTDIPVSLATSEPHAFGSRNLVMSGDGSRIFWERRIFDTELEEVGSLPNEIWATTVHGDLAISSTEVFDASTGASVYALPFVTEVMAVSGDQQRLFLFDGTAKEIRAIQMSEIAEVPGIGLIPDPEDGGTIVMPLPELSWLLSPLGTAYDVYFGTDEAAVAAATPTSAEYRGRVDEGRIPAPEPLELGRAYYWRVDTVGFAETTVGAVWSFTVAPLVATPKSIEAATAVDGSPLQMALELTADGEAVPWAVSEDIPWITLSHNSGTTPEVLQVTLDPADLEAGVHKGDLRFVSGEHSFEVPVQLELFEMKLTQLLTDLERPYLYGLHRGSGKFPDAFLLFINSESEQIEKAIPIGTNPTDMTINYGEDRLYVTNWNVNLTRVVDLNTQRETEPLELGRDVFKVNDGSTTGIYTEEEDQWITMRVIDTSDGAEVGRFFGREGDAKIDPSGSFYYHCDNNISNAHISKWDIRTDVASIVARSTQHPFGSRNLVMSGDGSRFFWRGYVYDADLNELGSIGDEIRATTFDGSIAFSSTGIYLTSTATLIEELPVETDMVAVSRDLKLFLFDEETSRVRVLRLDEDDDGIIGGVDNCPSVHNPDQSDFDGDGWGDGCDNCPTAANADQDDVIHPNEIGDACDDPEEDGVVDLDDNCPDHANSDQADFDEDTLGDACDPCIHVPNTSTVSLIANGGFETGNFDGWTLVDSRFGSWVANAGFFDPPGKGRRTPPIAGGFDALSYQFGPSTQLLRQSVQLPPDVVSAKLIWSDRVLNYRPGYNNPWHEWRVVVRDAALERIADVFRTAQGDPAIQSGPNLRSVDLTEITKAREGQTIIISFEHQITFFGFNVMLDDVELVVEHRVDCIAPIAHAGAEQQRECSGPGGTSVRLDGSGSTDESSTPGTNDDVVRFEWFEDYGQPTSLLIDEGEIVDTTLDLGSHQLTLRVTDSLGEWDTDETVAAVVDTVSPSGRITSPANGACHGPAALPVVIRDDFADICDPTLGRTYAPGPGPSYTEHGDHDVTLAAIDGSANTSSARVSFTIDTQSPYVELLGPPDGATMPTEVPLEIIFRAADDDSATGVVVHERVKLDGCVIYDGFEYGNRDGLLADESLRLDPGELCRISDACGFSVLDRPQILVEATDCGENVGVDSIRLSGSVALRPGLCGF